MHIEVFFFFGQVMHIEDEIQKTCIAKIKLCIFPLFLLR